MLDRAEIPFAHPKQDGTIELGVTADAVMDAWMELAAVPIKPCLLRLVSVVDEDRSARPILALARQISASLQQQYALAGRRQFMRQRTAACAGPDDDHVVAILKHGVPVRAQSRNECSGTHRRESVSRS